MRYSKNLDLNLPENATDNVDIDVISENFEILDEIAGSKENPHNVTKAQIGLGNVSNEKQVPAAYYGVAATSTDGIHYIATIDGLTELYTGLVITIVPNMKSKSTKVYLKINSFPEAMIKNMNQGLLFASADGVREDWITKDSPILLTYNGLSRNWETTLTIQKADQLIGILPLQKGGTGVTTLEELKSLLEIYKLKEKILNVKFGEYTGAGSSTDPVVLELGFKARFCMVISDTGYQSLFIMARENFTAVSLNSGDSIMFRHVSGTTDDTTIRWNHALSWAKLDSAGLKYYYIAIG